MSAPSPSRLGAFVLAGTLLAALPALSGCILVAAGAGAAGGYATLGQERSVSDQAKDAAIGAQISASWDQYSPELAHDLTATVYEGRVLITGRVPKQEWQQEAVQRAWKIEGVKEVYNEIEVGPDTHFMDSARDTVISTRLKNDMVFDSQIKSINYTVRVENGVVYVIGSARSQAELNRVTDYARNIPNVRRVVSYVRIRSGAPPAAQATNAAAPAATSAPTPPAASEDTPVGAPTPRSAIEVTPLK